MSRCTQELARHRPLIAQQSVAREANALAVVEGVVEGEEVREVVLNRDDVDIRPRKQPFAVFHDGLRLLPEGKGVETFLRGHQRKASQLVVADVGAEDHESRFPFRQLLIEVVFLDLDIELATAKHVKTVEDDLRKTTEIAIHAKESLGGTVSQPLVKVMIDRLVAFGEQKIERYHKNGHEAVHQSQGDMPYNAHKVPVHPFRTVCAASPGPFCRHAKRIRPPWRRYNRRTGPTSSPSSSLRA